MSKEIEQLAEIYERCENDLVLFRQMFLPAEKEVKPAWFHRKWGEVLLNGDRHYAVEGFRESAKALALNTVVPTPNGYTTIGNIQQGDVVLDEFGKPIEVEYVSGIFQDGNCFKVTFDTGEEVICDVDHLWTVYDKHKRRENTVSTVELYAYQNLGKPRNGYQEKAFRIPCTYAEYEEQELPIDPYVLGYWLGDGTASKPDITVGHQDIEEFEKIIGWKDYTKHEYRKGVYTVTLHGLRKLLIENGLINNKYIPMPYLFGSTNQRFNLLAGLIDSDGTIAKSGTKKGTVTFTNKSYKIAEGVKILANSLGMKTTLVERPAKLYGKDCGISYQVSFKPTVPFLRLQRKNKYIQTTQDKRSLMRTIKSVEKVDSVDCKCIKVKSESGLFQITPSHIITHNTSYVLRAFPIHCLVFPSKKKQYIVFIMANQRAASRRLKDIAEEYTSNELMNLNLVRIKEQSEKAFEIVVKDKNGEEITVRMEAYGKGSSVRGLNNKDRRPDIILIDDPQDLEDSLSDTVQKSDYQWFLSDVYFLGKNTRIFFIGNNLGEKCIIEQVISNKEELGFDAERIPVLDADGKSNWEEMYPVDAINDEREKWRKLGQLDIWEREKLCIAISPESQIFKKEYFRYYDPNVLNIEDCSIFVACDLAISEKETADFTSIAAVAVNSDNHWFLLEIDYGRWDPTKTIDTIFRMVQKYRPIFVGIEKVAYQAALIHFVEKEMITRNTWFTVKPLEAKEKKEIRIAALQPRFKAGTLWFPMGKDFLVELESELLSFPKSLHDDLIDSLAHIAAIASPPVGTFGTVNTADIPMGGAM